MNKAVSLYFHIPFCVSRCGYCNFYSTTELSMAERYIAALCGAIGTAPLEGREAVTLYFGGGTPSLLGTGLLTVLDAVRRRVPVPHDAEITLEANPGTIDSKALCLLRQGGFNRISFGLQAADDRTLGRMGRIHSAAQGEKAVECAREAGFENISADLMLGTPGQTAGDVERLCALAAKLAVPHVSAYLLRIEPDTPFGRTGVQADCPDPDQAADLYLLACKLLEAEGLEHYEISNFCKPGRESRHNSAYWRLSDYLGIGPAAYSFLDGQRFHFPPDLGAFVESGDPWALAEPDGPGGGGDEYLMLSLRLREGISLTVLSERYGMDGGQLAARAAPLIRDGLLTRCGDRLSLTDRGFLVSNSIILFLSEGQMVI